MPMTMMLTPDPNFVDHQENAVRHYGFPCRKEVCATWVVCSMYHSIEIEISSASFQNLPYFIYVLVHTSKHKVNR